MSDHFAHVLQILVMTSLGLGERLANRIEMVKRESSMAVYLDGLSQLAHELLDAP